MAGCANSCRGAALRRGRPVCVRRRRTRGVLGSRGAPLALAHLERGAFRRRTALRHCAHSVETASDADPLWWGDTLLFVSTRAGGRSLYDGSPLTQLWALPPKRAPVHSRASPTASWTPPRLPRATESGSPAGGSTRGARIPRARARRDVCERQREPVAGGLGAARAHGAWRAGTHGHAHRPGWRVAAAARHGAPAGPDRTGRRVRGGSTQHGAGSGPGRAGGAPLPAPPAAGQRWAGRRSPTRRATRTPRTRTSLPRLRSRRRRWPMAASCARSIRVDAASSACAW
jgi:hypothetical protein